MKLRRVKFTNFKLLDGVTIDFSLDPDRPLTVVRAENGSGKTSLMWGLFWALYGHAGLPSQDARLTSKARRLDIPTTVQVRLEFDHDPDGLGSNEYLLIRTVQETPSAGSVVTHGPTDTKLFVRRPAGEEPVPGDPDTVIQQFFPQRLREVFLTDGDRVQRFISTTVAAKERQHNVHEAIRALLGLDRLDAAEVDITHVERKLRKELADSGGEEVAKVEAELEQCEELTATLRSRIGQINDRRTKIEEHIEEVEKRLSEIRGHGDLDTINADLQRARADFERAETDESVILESVRASFKSDETLTWCLAASGLDAGQKVLADLYDQRVIPGTSLGVIQDRLNLSKCICGEDLSPGTTHRRHVEDLLSEQASVSEEQERLTELFHHAQSSKQHFDAAEREGVTILGRRDELLAAYTAVGDQQKEAAQRIKRLEKRREDIDEEDVRRYTAQVSAARGDLAESSEEFGGVERELLGLDAKQQQCRKRYESALAAAKSDVRARHHHDIAHDLQQLVSSTLQVLKVQHVKDVSQRMEEIFMRIVGGAPELKGAVFHGVQLTENFDIEVRTANQEVLDADYEVNGASQRALTLAFIWALMEVSGTVAPRVIDTPLGMTAGGVRRRMVDAITEPVAHGRPDYQVVLLLTRSEIRDIEDLLDSRGGVCLTLSCSKDYPTDLVNDWGVDEPTIRRCDCHHGQFCTVCERVNDAADQLVRRN